MFVELRSRLALLDDLFRPFSRQGALDFCNRQTRIYLILTVMLGATGYLFLFVFPALLVVMPVTLFYSLQSAVSTVQWFYVSAQALVLLVAALVTYGLLTVRFPLPSGLELTHANFPRLFELLRELCEIYGEPRIDRVVLRDRFDVRLVKTPRNGFSLSTTRTLVVGLPVLLTMSPLDVHVLLARRVGQLAGKHSRLQSWLYFLRDMWGHYMYCCHGQRFQLILPVCGFFQFYAPSYRTFSVGLARYSELDADRYALQAVNDRDTAMSITRQVLTDTYLTRSYWPQVLQSAKQSASCKTPPHAGMAKFFEGGGAGEEIKATMKRIERGGEVRKSTWPSLTERLYNIGHDSPSPPKSLSVTAASYYLGSATDKCVAIIDKRSLSKLRSEVIRDVGSEDR